MLGTYHSMRQGIGFAGLLLPWVLWIGGCLFGPGSLQESMSQYYHTPMRNVFVGTLMSIGFVLFLYQGFSDLERRVLNAGGFLAIGVALIPTAPAGGASTIVTRVHAACAILFFMSIAYVAIFRAGDTLSLERDQDRVKLLRRTYVILGICMAAFPVGAAVVATWFKDSLGAHTIFFVEAAGVVAFSAYWLVKSIEMKENNGDELAVEGKLLPQPAGALAQGSVLQLEPDTAREEMEYTLRKGSA